MTARWMQWERPWTRSGGVVAGYERMSRVPSPGDVVALRQSSRPYLPTFAPWWAGLVVDEVTIKGITFAGQRVVARLDKYPIPTHWALLATPPMTEHLRDEAAALTKGTKA